MSSSDFLATMAASSQQRADESRARVPEGEVMRRALAGRPPPRLQISTQRFDLIAEVKLRSPAAGKLQGLDDDVVQRALGYVEGGAAAVSVLTEPTRFDGSLEHLQKVAMGLRGQVPAMRKDFLVDPYQVLEARMAGAGGVLLILRMLTRRQQELLVEAALRMGLFVLLECFDENDVRQGEALLSDYGRWLHMLFGVNSRDLSTLKVVPDRLETLVKALPAGVLKVAESGIATAEDAARVAVAGYDLALVGSALMTSETPVELVAELLAAGRAARGGEAGPAA